MKKVLHISNWYPNKWDDLEGIFVKEQFNIFTQVTHSHLIHVEVRKSNLFYKYNYIKYSETEEGYYILSSIKSNKLIEFLSTFLLFWALFQSKYRRYDLLHFHIAYPLLSYYSLWKKIIKIPILMSEHWSAYHFNFYMPWETKKLDRIKNIFRQNIPLITVSQSLLEDIEIFSGIKISQVFVIPNVIDIKYFYYQKSIQNDSITFFALNHWRDIKNPFPMLEGFKLLHEKEIAFQLIIGGYGELLSKMKAFVLHFDMSSKVQFIGKMNKKEIAMIMVKSNAYLVSSTYETFSIVCAEALSTGTPLIGIKLSAIKEYTNKESYLSFEHNTAEEWMHHILYFIENKESYKPNIIASNAKKYFEYDSIKKAYSNILNKYI